MDRENVCDEPKLRMIRTELFRAKPEDMTYQGRRGHKKGLSEVVGHDAHDDDSGGDDDGGGDLPGILVGWSCQS